VSTIVVKKDNTRLVVQRATTPVLVDRAAVSPVLVGGAAAPVLVDREAVPVLVDRAAVSTVQVVARGPQGPRGERGPPGADASGQVPPIPFSWGDAPREVFTAPTAGVLAIVRIQYTTAFNGSGASVRVGTATEVAMPESYNNPYTTHEFENSPDLMLDEGDVVYLTITPGTASAGAGLLFLTFIPTE
jgi:hypothetical protein